MTIFANLVQQKGVLKRYRFIKRYRYFTKPHTSGAATLHRRIELV